jgi:hypothetical protein
VNLTRQGCAASWLEVALDGMILTAGSPVWLTSVGRSGR